MFDFDPFDMDMDGVVDGIDFLGFDYLIRYVLEREDSEEDEATEDYEMWHSEMPWDFQDAPLSALCRTTVLQLSTSSTADTCYLVVDKVIDSGHHELPGET